VEATGDDRQTLPAFRSAWRTEVAIRIDELEHRLEVATQSPAPAPTGPSVDETITALTPTGEITVRVEEVPHRRPVAPPEIDKVHVDAMKLALRKAGEAIQEPGFPTRLAAWWTGAAVTAGWEYLHEAEAELVHLEADQDIRASLPRLLTWIQEVMPKGDQRTRYERQLTKFIDGEEVVDRTVVRQAYHDVILANNEKHVSLRELRNRLLLAIPILALMLVLVGAWHAVNPNFISMCGVSRPAAAVTASGSSASKEPEPALAVTRCVNGSSQPSGRDVFEIELIGAIAGLLSVAFGLGATKTPPSRYDPRLMQIALKPVAGAATALIGVIFVQSEVLIAPASQISESVLFAYAAVFGFSQQLLTQFVDKRADKLLSEPDASQEDDKKK
jgi:hypothetical protein